MKDVGEKQKHIVLLTTSYTQKITSLPDARLKIVIMQEYAVVVKKVGTIVFHVSNGQVRSV